VRLPDLVIIGGPRCGTSSLWAMLKALPGVRTPRIKEVHFFNRKWDRGLRWYAGFFSGAGDESLCFEATPAYLAAPKAAERAAAVLPKTRFVAMLRDPVARAISHYWPNKHRFPRRLGALTDPRSRCVVPGRYVEHLERWYRHVGRERILVIISERFFEDPVREATQVLLHVGRFDLVPHLRPAYYDPLARWRKKYGTPRVPPHVVRWLRKHYEEPNRRLAEMLAGDNITADWMDGRIKPKERT